VNLFRRVPGHQCRVVIHQVPKISNKLSQTLFTQYFFQIITAQAAPYDLSQHAYSFPHLQLFLHQNHSHVKNKLFGGAALNISFIFLFSLKNTPFLMLSLTLSHAFALNLILSLSLNILVLETINLAKVLKVLKTLDLTTLGILIISIVGQGQDMPKKFVKRHFFLERQRIRPGTVAQKKACLIVFVFFKLQLLE
jgi:hypothetical protein